MHTGRNIFTFFVFLTFLTIFSACDTSGDSGSVKQTEINRDKGDNPVVLIRTNYGEIEIELFQNEAPVTVRNFLNYVEQDFYEGTLFHRVIPGFMIQGGGFTEGMERKETADPIKNEADNGLRNERGTVAMARTSEVNSATSQFFINLADNDFLNHGVRDFGYAVFGKVISGMEVVEKIASVETESRGYMQNIPSEPVVIESVRIKGAEN